MVHHASPLVKQISLEVKRNKHGFSMVNDSEMGGFGFFLRQFYFIYMDMFGASQAQMESISSNQLSAGHPFQRCIGKMA